MWSKTLLETTKFKIYTASCFKMYLFLLLLLYYYTFDNKMARNNNYIVIGGMQ